MKALKQNINDIIVCVFELVIGILLLIDPVGFTSGIIIAGGICLLAIGVYGTIKYFRTDAREAAASQLLMKGLLAILGGAFCVFNSYWFVATFEVLAMIYGISILVAGIGKVQISVDMLRLKKPKWYFAMISAAVSVVCALIILYSPFLSASALWLFTSISLIVEAVFDVVTLIVNWKAKAESDDADVVDDTWQEDVVQENVPQSETVSAQPVQESVVEDEEI